MPALHAVQGICGNWLPLEALKLVAEGMDIPYPYLYGVMSFYTMFSPTPRGKYIIRLCESPPCHIMGAENLVSVLKGELGIKVGETTPTVSLPWSTPPAWGSARSPRPCRSTRWYSGA